MNDVLGDRSRFMQLLLWRGMAAMLVLFIAAWFYLPTVGQEQRKLLAYVAFLFVAFAAVQSVCFRFRWSRFAQLFFQFASDVFVVGLLVIATGGVESPFVLLFGLIIVAAGTQAQVLLVLTLAVLACIAYLSAIYLFAWWQHIQLPVGATLNLLLQTSVLMLVGGVMATIARRHARLYDESSRVAQEHRNLQTLHTRLMGLMQEGVLVLDAQLRIQDSNPAAWKILQITSDSALDFREVWPVPRVVLDFLEQPDGDHFRCEWRRDNVEYLVTVGRFPEVRADANWWLTFVDVSELRDLERKFNEHEKLAAMGRMTAMLAHELRNPMQTIAQAVELVSKVSKARQETIQDIINEEMMRLNRLITDMLDYTRPLKPILKEEQVVDLVEASIQQVDPERALGIHSKLNVDSLYIDAGHLRLVLDNLLRNAILASPERNTVCVQLSQNEGAWKLVVMDHGDGIPEALQRQIFEPFDTHRANGTGLGLATVWQVCQANQWSVDVESDGHKTSFCISGSRVKQDCYG